MDLNARVDVNCESKDGLVDRQTDGWTEKWMSIWHLKAGVTRIILVFFKH